MLLKIHSASLTGIRAEILDIEVDISSSHKFSYQVVGLPDTAVRESGDRVRAATRNCGYAFPPSGTIIVNLAPADFKKEGSGYLGNLRRDLAGGDRVLAHHGGIVAGWPGPDDSGSIASRIERPQRGLQEASPARRQH